MSIRLSNAVMENLRKQREADAAPANANDSQASSRQATKPKGKSRGKKA